jgi:hypothetical protein
MKYRHDKNKWFPNENPSLFERILCKIFRVRIIPTAEGNIYLRRIYLTPRWKWLPFKIFLHHFFSSDIDRSLHDHPWVFRTFILNNGYEEIIQEHEYPDAVFRNRILTAGDTVRNEAEHTHRVIVPKPLWTLMIVHKAKRAWGFHDKDLGWVHWRKYLNMEDEIKFPDYPEDII